MTSTGDNADINAHLKHRGVRFALKRITPADARLSAYLWTIYPASEAPNGAEEGFVDGRRSFNRAYAAAQAAIDQWLVVHSQDGEAGSASS